MKPSYLFHSCLLLFVVAVYTSSCKQAEKKAEQPLAFNPASGITFRYSVDMDMEQTAGPQSTRVGTHSSFDLKIKDRVDTVYDIDVSYSNFSMNINNGGMKMDIDPANIQDQSAGKDEIQKMQALMSRMFAGILNKPFNMRVTTRGDIIALTGVDALVTGILEKSELGPESAEMVRASLRDQINAAELRDMLQPSFSFYPNIPVKVGDTWTRRMSQGRSQTIGMINYTVQGVTDSTIVLRVNGTLSPQNKQEGMSGTYAGQTILHRSSGLVKEANIQQLLSQGESDWQVKVKSDIRIQGKEL